MSDEQAPEWFDAAKGEPVVLSPPRPEWRETAERWARDVRAALAPLDVDVEHIGSTAVPGLAAKPVVDLLVAVPDLADEPSYRRGLEALGLVLRQREEGRRFFRPPATAERTVHVHVCQQGSSCQREHLAFRDHLRAHPDVAAQYEALKRRLAATVGHDRESYTEGKTRFVAAVLRRAGARASS